MERTSKFCVSIAGLDSSGGAGLLADIKTMEQNGVHGLGVCTGITYQNEKSVYGIDWLSEDQILKQLITLFEIYKPAAAKIGIVKDIAMLKSVTDFLISQNKSIAIVWDPVMKSSSGFDFHLKNENWIDELENITLLTPNIFEARVITGIEDEEKAALYLARQCNVLLKGGHSESESSTDLLFTNEKIISISGDRFNGTKRGTGCVLSSAIASQLALGKDLEEACRNGKDYVMQYLLSTSDLLGYHHQIKFISNEV